MYAPADPDPDRYGRVVVEEAGDVKAPLVYRLAKHHYTPCQLVAIDIAAIAFLFLLWLGFVPSTAPARVSGGMWEAVEWSTGSAAAVVLLLRRRYPRLVLAFLLAVEFLTLCLRANSPMPFFVILALYSVVAASGRRMTVAAVVVSSAVGIAGVFIAGGAGAVQSAIGSEALVLFGWLAGENTKTGRIFAAHAKERAAERAEAEDADRAEQVRRAVADERVEIARELHDIVAHAISVIAVRSGVARMVMDTQPEQAREALTIIESTTRRSLQEMRLLVGVLRDADDHPAELGPMPGLADIDALVGAMAAAGVDVEVEVDGPPRPLTPAADLSAYRIVQEALTNVARHAGPTRARVEIAYRSDEVVLEVTDDGPQGAAPALPRAGSGHGLIGMRERAALFGGDLVCGPHGPGFRVRARLRTERYELQAQR